MGYSRQNWGPAYYFRDNFSAYVYFSMLPEFILWNFHRSHNDVHPFYKLPNFCNKIVLGILSSGCPSVDSTLFGQLLLNYSTNFNETWYTWYIRYCSYDWFFILSIFMGYNALFSISRVVSCLEYFSYTLLMLNILDQFYWNLVCHCVLHGVMGDALVQNDTCLYYVFFPVW